MSTTPAEHDDLRITFSLTIACTIWLVHTPLCAYMIFKFYRYRNNIILKKRHSEITMPFLFISLALSAIFYPFNLIAFSNYIYQYEDYRQITFQPTLILILQTLFIFVWKQWLYLYDVNYMKATSDKEWVQCLNPSSVQNNWFIKNKKSFGSNGSSLFYKIMILLFILVSFTMTIWEFIPIHVSFKKLAAVLVGGLWVFFIIAALSIIKHKTPNIQDPFFIRKESSYFIYSLLISILWIIINYVLSAFVLLSTKYSVIGIGMNYFIMATTNLILVYVSSLWVIQNNKHWIMMSDLNKYEHSTTSATGTIMRDMSVLSMSKSYENTANDQSKSKTIKEMNLDAIKNEKIFDMFMQHLITEFSMEIMLSLIEITQLRQQIYEYGQNHNMFNSDDISFNFFVYPSSVPKSSIVHDALNTANINLINEISSKIKDNKNMEIKKKAIEFLIRSHKIYSKYIKTGCEFELNLSYQQRNILVAEMDDFGVWINHLNDSNNDIEDEFKMLFELFSKAAKEMFVLLGYSFTRFKFDQSDMIY